MKVLVMKFPQSIPKNINYSSVSNFRFPEMTT